MTSDGWSTAFIEALRYYRQQVEREAEIRHGGMDRLAELPDAQNKLAHAENALADVIEALPVRSSDPSEIPLGGGARQVGGRDSKANREESPL